MEILEINPDGIKEADIVVAIPSYNEADSIAFPTTQASIGLKRYFSDRRCVIINCDNNSPDNTKDVFLNTPTDVPKIYISTPPGIKGKGNNFKNLFRKVLELGAEAVVVVDADLKSITPQWIKNLGEPLYMDFSYVTPLYVRHKYDGTITNGIAYPMCRALYGRRIRQPIGGDFGFRSELANVYLESETWNEAVANFGIDIWMTTIALTQRIQVCQSYMGRPKIHRPKDPAASLGPMFREVVGTIFYLMIHFEDIWKNIKFSRPTAVYGFGLGEVEMPPKVEVNTVRLMEEFHKGFEEYQEVWKDILSSDVMNKLLEIKDLKERHFTFPTELWAMVLYDMAIAYRDENLERDLIIDSLIPLYYGRTLSFVKRTRRMSTKQAEETIEEDCMVFEKAKPYLLRRWNERR